jgi:hypothetical protein
VKQHTSPFEQFAELVHERDAPPWHCPFAVHDEVIPRPNPPRRAQHTCVPASHVVPPHGTPVPLDDELPLDADVIPPLLEPEDPPDDDVDPDAPLLEPDDPPDVDDVDPDPPLLDVEPLVEAPPPELPDPDPLAEPSSPVPGMRSSKLGTSSPVRPQPSPNKAAAMETVLMAFIGGCGVAASAPLRARPAPLCI